MFSTGAASAPDSPITILAPTHKVQALLRAFLSIPVDPDNLMGTNLSTHFQGSSTELEANSSTPRHFPQFNILTSIDHGTVHTQLPLTLPSNSEPQPSPSHSSPQESTTSCTPLTTTQTLTSHTKHHHALHFIHTPSKLPSP